MKLGRGGFEPPTHGFSVGDVVDPEYFMPIFKSKIRFFKTKIKILKNITSLPTASLLPY
jgi:hypothetical protein